MTARLVITDGTTTVSLLGPVFHLDEWRPNVAAYKDGGQYANSPLGDGQTLIDYRFDNAVDTFELVASTVSQDALIRWQQDLRRLLEKAASFRANSWPNSPIGPVWLEARASQESNTRYAQVVSGRMPEDDNPFSQPFLQPECRAVMRELSLIIERGHWQEAAPGEEVCLPLTLHSDYGGVGLLNLILDTKGLIGAWPFTDETNPARNYSRHGSLLNGQYTAGMLIGANGDPFLTGERVAFVPVSGGAVDLLDKPNLANFFNGDRGSFVIWMRSSGLIWTDGDEHYVAYFYADSDNFITIRKTINDNEIEATVKANGIAHTVSGTVPPSTDQWVSIGLTWRPDSFPRIILYINGGAVDTGFHYIGNFTGDLTAAIIGAEDLPGGSATPGLSSNIAYAALFEEWLTPTQILPMLSSPDPSSGDETSCERVYVANKRSEAKITHAYYADTSAASFSANIVTHDYESGNAALLPPTPAAGDFLYFGSTTSITPAGGPFSSIVLDLDSDGNPCITGDWEYWNGAWTALDVMDNTGALDNPGIGSIHWEQPSDWVANSINSVTAFWVRLEITGAGSCSLPRQQNRPPYTIRRPYLDVPAGSLPGDISSLVRMAITGWADLESGSEPVLRHNRVYIGSRRLDRGNEFPGYINLSDVQNPTGITVSVGANTTFGNDRRAPSGRAAIYNPTGTESLATRAQVDIDPNIATDMTGTFRAFVRAQAAGGSTTWTIRLVIETSTSIQTTVTETVDAINPAGSEPMVVSLGTITLPPGLRLSSSDTSGPIEIWVQVSSSNGTNNLNLYDLILIPVDELSILAESESLDSTADMIGYHTDVGRTSLEIDGAVDSRWSPKAQLTSLDLGGQVISRWRMVSPTSVALDDNLDHRIWFLFTSVSTREYGEPDFAVGIEGDRMARYLSARGNR